MLLTFAPILLVVAAAAGPQSPAIPDTPAGYTLEAWLEAFNSGDRARIQAYLAKYEPTQTVEETLAFREQTGGFDLLGVDKSEKLHIEFRVKEKASPTTAVGKIDVKDADPGEIVHFALRAIPPGLSAADMNIKIDAATRSRVIDGAIANLNEFYIFPDTAKKMEESLRARQKKGEYDSVEDAESFASLLTDHLQQVSHDKHLHVMFSPEVVSKDEDRRHHRDDDAPMRAQIERDNCLFDKVERLPSNIGYLKFNAFLDPELCGPTAIAAMNFLAHVDAIIFDLRDNGGGDPKMIALVSTYLFDEPYVPGKRLAGKPAFVLTSHRTFSGAEEFSYNLKNLKRATLVGETTGGGAHPVSGHRIDDHFMIGVPFARAVNPISNTNWEGTGVEPDVKVAAAEALEVAKKMAAEQIQKEPTNKK